MICSSYYSTPFFFAFFPSIKNIAAIKVYISPNIPHIPTEPIDCVFTSFPNANTTIVIINGIIVNTKFPNFSNLSIAFSVFINVSNKK